MTNPPTRIPCTQPDITCVDWARNALQVIQTTYGETYGAFSLARLLRSMCWPFIEHTHGGRSSTCVQADHWGSTTGANCNKKATVVTIFMTSRRLIDNLSAAILTNYYFFWVGLVRGVFHCSAQYWRLWSTCPLVTKCMDESSGRSQTSCVDSQLRSQQTSSIDREWKGLIISW